MLPDDFSCSLYLPARLHKDLNAFCDEYCVKKHLRNSYILFLAILCIELDKVFKRATLKKGFSIEKLFDSWRWKCNLYSSFLKNHLGNDYNDIVNTLISAGFIERSRHYSKSCGKTRGISKAYWLTKTYRTYFYNYLRTKFMRKNYLINKICGKMVEIKIEDRVLLKRIYKIKCEQKYSELSKNNISTYYQHLSHFWIDTEAAQNTLEDLKANEKISDINEEMTKVTRFNSVNDDPMARYVKEDDYGRVHTNVTSLKREVRDGCMYCDGKPVGGVDIKSSQASFLCSIMHEWRNVAYDTMYVPESNFVEIIPFWKENEFAISLDNEIDAFEHILRDGKMYEFFAGHMSNLGVTYTRDEAKKAFLSTLFAHNYIPDTKPERKAVRDVWAEYFPHMLRCINFMKRNNHACLAYEMQRTESSFVFDVVIPRIEREIGCHYCTVHDSVIVPVEYISRVQKIMDEELKKAAVPTMTKVECNMLNPPTEVLRSDAIIEEEMKLAQAREIGDDYLNQV